MKQPIRPFTGKREFIYMCMLYTNKHTHTHTHMQLEHQCWALDDDKLQDNVKYSTETFQSSRVSHTNTSFYIVG